MRGNSTVTVAREGPSAPSICMVVPSYNQAEWIESCLNSIIMQKEPEDQLIVVDGYSTDGSQEVIEKVESSIDVTIVEEDQGQADALRKGFAHANSDICGYLNTDDLLLPGTLNYVRHYFNNNPEVDAIYSHRIFMDDANRIVRFWVIPFHSNYCMNRWDYIPQETCFWRRSLMQEVGTIDSDLQFAMDYDLFIRMMQRGRVKRVNRFLAAFRDHPRSKTRQLYGTIGQEEVASIQEKYGIRFHWYDRIIGNLYGQLVLKLGLLFRLAVFPAARTSLEKRIQSASRIKV